MEEKHLLPYSLEETENEFLIVSEGVYIGKIFKNSIQPTGAEKAEQQAAIAKATGEYIMKAANNYKPDATYIDLMHQSLAMVKDKLNGN